MADVQPIPENYPRVTPSLCIDGAADAIEFYKDVFGATQRGPIFEDRGRVGHAEVEIGDSLLMVADEYPDMGFLGPKKVGGSPIVLSVYVEDVDAVVQKATSKGATVRRPVENQFYGDRSGQIEDPWGHVWNVATHVEDVPPDEMQRRVAAMQEG